MNYLYLKITGTIVWGTNAITRDDLIALRDGRYDAIIDLQNMTQFNADANEWKEIEGDK